MSTLKVEKIQHPNSASVALTLDTSGYLALQAGSASTPAIQGPSDPNTGIFFPAADTIAFAEGGTEVLRIDSSGRVGIGTSSPSANLHVAAAVSDPILFSNTSGSAYNTAVWQNNNNFKMAVGIGGGSVGGGLSDVAYIGPISNIPLNIQTNNTARISITAGGNVGIGTTSPSVKLEVSGTANTNEIRSVDGTINSQWYQDNNGYAIFGTFSNHPQVFRTNGTERVRIQSGNGGISIGSSQNPNALTQSTGIRLGDNTVASHTFTNVTTTPVTIANGVGIGGLGFIQAFNTSNGAQYTGIIMWRSGVVAVVSESNALGFGLTFSVSGSTLRLQTASGTVTGSIISLGG
jgi:hypothetical protein